MTRTGTHSRGRTSQRAVVERRMQWAMWTIYGLVAVLAVILGISIAVGPGGDRAASSSNLPLPNPMGGPAMPAPPATGDPVTVGGLEVAASVVEMGDVPLNVTVVPSWRATNQTSGDLTFAVGQPEVHEGCCPGPVYVDEQMVTPGGTVTVPAGGAVLVQFPLQMHPGMDGPHHLTVPLAVGAQQTDLHVTGNFTAAA